MIDRALGKEVTYRQTGVPGADYYGVGPHPASPVS